MVSFYAILNFCKRELAEESRTSIVSEITRESPLVIKVMVTMIVEIIAMKDIAGLTGIMEGEGIKTFKSKYLHLYVKVSSSVKALWRNISVETLKLFKSFLLMPTQKMKRKKRKEKKREQERNQNNFFPWGN